MTGPQRTSAQGQELIKFFEGCELETYVCASGQLTQGYGHCGPEVQMGQTITQEQADQLLRDDLQRFEDATERWITVQLDQSQFDALVSWGFNVGTGAMAESTLRRRLNQGEDVNLVLSQELPKWNKGASGPLPGLTKRRAAEVKLAVEKQFP